MNKLLLWRKLVKGVMLTLTAVCAVVTVAALFVILGLLIYNGGRSLSWSFFTHLPAPPGELGGGLANAIVGTLLIVFAPPRAPTAGSQSTGWVTPSGFRF